MRLRIMLLLAFLTAAFGLECHAFESLKSSHIHWSNASKLRSPDGEWTLSVRPASSGDGPADVYLSRRGTDSQSPLFGLERDGEVYWRPTSGMVVIDDEKSSNNYRILVFDFNAPSEKSALVLNEQIVRDVKERVGEDNQIAYYFPRFSQWTTDGDPVIAVGAITVRNGSGPFTAHCFGYIANGESQTVRSLSEGELKNKYGTSCQTWP